MKSLNPPRSTAILLLILCSHFSHSQTCESFDNFNICGNNLFDCLTNGGCPGAFTTPGWANSLNDDIDWSVSNIPTPSLGTGPAADHTSGTGKFLFVESSFCYNKTAILISPVYPLSGISNPELQFWYHMFGRDMGSLTVEIESPSGSGNWTMIWQKSGNQGNKWYLSIINLSAYSTNSVRFRFTGITGDSFESDMALDDVCVASGCVLNCNDNNTCTEDFCYNGNCLNQAKDCDDNDPCTVDACVNGACFNNDLECDDGNPCTFDYCFTGICFSDPPCDDYDDCTIDSCDISGNCFHIEINCEDGDPCTLDICEFGTCYNNPKCDDFDDCTIDFCDAQGVCSNDPIVCNDGIACTDDYCLFGICIYDIICSDNDPCTVDQCASNGCSYPAASSCLCREPGKQVGANPVTITDSILITNKPGLILDLNVSIDISHTWISDLEIELTSPGGTTISLFNSQCDSEEDIKAMYDDAGAIPDCPPTGFRRVMPFGFLSSFNNEPMNGLWVLRVTDTYPFDDDGTLNKWCLIPTLSCAGNADCDDGNPCTVGACDNGACVYTPTGNCAIAISGTVMTETGVPVPTVTVQLQGTGSENKIADNSGNYSFNVAQGGNYTVTPSKNNDLNSNNGITTLDLLFIRRHILDIALLSSPYKIIAADVNQSNSVTTLDILLTRSVILQINQSFAGKLWSFVPHDFVFDNALQFPIHPNNRTYNNINASVSAQNFIAIKLGDVNDSWDPNVQKMQAADDLRLAMDERHAMTGEEIVVPVSARDFHDVAGYQFTVSWDAQVLQLLDANNRALNGHYGTHRAQEGYLTTSWDDEMAGGVTLDDDAILFELKFKVIGGNGTQSDIAINSELTASEAYNGNLDLLNILTQNGSVKVGDVTGIANTGVQPIRLSVQPNPFTNASNVVFRIGRELPVNVIICDVLGRVVKAIIGNFPAGEHRIEWNGKDENGAALSPGLYHVKLIAGEYSATTKAVLLK